MRTLEDLQSEAAQILDMVRLSTLDMELRLEVMYRLGATLAYIATIQSMVQEAEYGLRMAQELVRSALSSQTQH